jgi:hypothetical protein
MQFAVRGVRIRNACVGVSWVHAVAVRIPRVYASGSAHPASKGVCIEGVCIEGVCIEGACIQGVCIQGVCIQGGVLPGWCASRE